MTLTLTLFILFVALATGFASFWLWRDGQKFDKRAGTCRACNPRCDECYREEFRR